MIELIPLKKYEQFFELYMRYLKESCPIHEIKCKSEGKTMWNITIGEIGLHQFSFVTEERDYMSVHLFQVLTQEDFEQIAKTILKIMEKIELDIFISIQKKMQEEMLYQIENMIENWIPSGQRATQVKKMMLLLEEKVKIEKIKQNQYVYQVNCKQYPVNMEFVCQPCSGTVDVYVRKEKYDVCKNEEELESYILETEKEQKMILEIEKSLEDKEVFLDFRIEKKFIDHKMQYALRTGGFLNEYVFEKIEVHAIVEKIIERKNIIKKRRNMRDTVHKFLYEQEPYCFSCRGSIRMFQGDVAVDLKIGYNEELQLYTLGLFIKEDGQKIVDMKVEGTEEKIHETIENKLNRFVKGKKLKNLLKTQKNDSHMDKIKAFFDTEEDIVFEDGVEKEKEKIEQEILLLFKVDRQIPYIKNYKKMTKTETENYRFESKLNGFLQFQNIVHVYKK